MKSKKHYSILAVTLITSLFIVKSAIAGPPFFTDDPQPVDLHHWEIYVASINANSHGDWSGTAPHIEINYGAAPELQLHMIAPMGYDAPADGPAHYGFADLELGAKYRFVQETNGWPQIGTFPLLEVPTGNSHLGAGHTTALIPVWAQKSWDKWTLYGGGGYGINSFSGHGNWGFGGAVLQNQVRSNLLVGVEIYHQTVAQVDFPNEGTGFNIGTVLDFSDNHHLLFSAGRSIDGPNAFQCYIAYQLTFEKSLWKFWTSRHAN